MLARTRISKAARIALAATLWLVSGGHARAIDRSHEVKAFLHDRRSSIVIDSGSREFPELLASCEGALVSARDMAQLAVFPSTIQDIERNGLSVELEYSKARHFTPGYGNRKNTVEANHLLIEIHGPQFKSADGRVLVFFGKFSRSIGTYSSGPYISEPGYEGKLLAALNKIGVKNH